MKPECPKAMDWQMCKDYYDVIQFQNIESAKLEYAMQHDPFWIGVNDTIMAASKVYHAVEWILNYPIWIFQ